jgi:hypothetical protein
MKPALLTLCATFLGCTLGRIQAAEPPPLPTESAEFFEKHVRPVLSASCFPCHGAEKQRSGLRLDFREALLKGGDNGPAVKPGDPEQSRLIRLIRREGEIKMPPKEKLAPEDIEALTAWIKMGAPWPDSTGGTSGRLADDRRLHWSFQPVKKPALPAVRNASWIQSPVDAFILAQLEAKGFKPARPPDRRTLLRRVTFDLTGLPPTPEEVAAFEADTSPEAFAHVVDRLLASPRYGERWGRYWLDVARYADTKGYVFQEERRYPYAYTYRDYVIHAFNEDLPYDQFLLQQLAADRLPPGTDQRSLAALGFLTLGRRFLNNTHDIIDDRIDVVSRGLLGLTVTCARCHDHKFDPIPTKDYYSLYGIFNSSEEPAELPLLGPPEPTQGYLAFVEEMRKLEDNLSEFDKKHQEELKSGNRAIRDQRTELKKKIDALQATSPAAPPRAMVLQDTPVPREPHVFLRGNPNNQGEAVPRQFLLVLSGPSRQPFHEGSGRLELARAIASPDNPLTARVLVNRVWLHHFGAGLVRTPSDFGMRGEAPTHPELLDYLSAQFVEDGWSIKKLHRLILLSSTYQQDCAVDPAVLEQDPENRLLSHMNRQRLDFEALRDSLLAVAGTLDTRSGGPSVEITTAPFATRRSVYGIIERQNLPGLFRTFDFASPDTTNPQRFTTTVPQQALFLMNSAFVTEQARHLANRPDVVGLSDVESKIRRLYQLSYGRQPDADEINLGKRYLESSGRVAGAGAWAKYAQVLLLANEFAFVD